MPRSFVFGAKEYTSKQVQDACKKVMRPLGECELTLSNLIEGLTRDAWPVADGNRSTRATGAAIGVALGLMEGVGRVMLFCGG